MVDVAIATPLSTSGRFIVDAHANRVRLAGVNWYGASEDEGVPVGLDVIDRHTLAQLIASFGFNSVRLPFSAWMTEQTAAVPQQYLAANPDLQGATPIKVYDACVEALTGAGLMVIPNCHLLDFGWCCADQDGNGLWFNDRWLTANEVDWCWWALNPVHGKSCNPGINTPKYTWGQPEPYGLLTQDWSNAAYPSVISLLQAVMPPRTGAGVS